MVISNSNGFDWRYKNVVLCTHTHSSNTPANACLSLFVDCAMKGSPLMAGKRDNGQFIEIKQLENIHFDKKIVFCCRCRRHRCFASCHCFWCFAADTQTKIDKKMCVRALHQKMNGNWNVERVLLAHSKGLCTSQFSQQNPNLSTIFFGCFAFGHRFATMLNRFVQPFHEFFSFYSYFISCFVLFRVDCHMQMKYHWQ